MYDDESVEKTSKKIVDSVNGMAFKGKKTKNYLKDGKSVVSVGINGEDSKIKKGLISYIENTDKAVKSSARKVVVDID